jgi:heme-degrading monooxygenase HmoA
MLAKIFTVYSWTVKRGQGQEFVEAWKGFARWAISQTGSSGSTRLFRDTDDPTHFMSVDSWQNLELLESIRKGMEYGRRIDDLRKLLYNFASWPLELEAEERDSARTYRD